MMKRDVDYVVRDGEIIIVDEFTGRLMFGRRYSNGLHQAIEAKEGVLVQSESKTLATITLQNYFRMYGKLAVTSQVQTLTESIGQLAHEKPVFSISSGFFELDLEELGDKSLFLVSAFMVGMRLLQDGYPAHVKVI